MKPRLRRRLLTGALQPARAAAPSPGLLQPALAAAPIDRGAGFFSNNSILVYLSGSIAMLRHSGHVLPPRSRGRRRTVKKPLMHVRQSPRIATIITITIITISVIAIIFLIMIILAMAIMIFPRTIAIITAKTSYDLTLFITFVADIIAMIIVAS